MSTSQFPATSIDTFSNPSAGSFTDTPSLAAAQTLQNDSIFALETKVGVNNSAVTTSLDYLLKSTSSVSPGHKHSAAELTTGTIPVTVLNSGATVQTVFTETGAVATGTTIIPIDDTIPQITEGDQYLSKAITPTSATNQLMIEVILQVAHTATNHISMALFQDSTANALASVLKYNAVVNTHGQLVLRHIMTAGTTSATTFKVRAGADVSGTTTINGASGARIQGGVLASSIRITELHI